MHVCVCVCVSVRACLRVRAHACVFPGNTVPSVTAHLNMPFPVMYAPHLPNSRRQHPACAES